MSRREGEMCLDLEHVAFVTMSTGDDHNFGQPHIVDETSRSMSVFFQNSSIFESGPSCHFWFLEHFLPLLVALDLEEMAKSHSECKSRIKCRMLFSQFLSKTDSIDTSTYG